MKRTLFLGDLHGNFSLVGYYVDTYGLKDANIIQVGDFGVGFALFQKDKKNLELYQQKLVENNVILWVVRGNHDFKPYFDNDPFELTNIKLVPDYTVLNFEGKNILCIGGAHSVDRRSRYTKRQFIGDFDLDRTIPNADETWWHDENFVFNKEKLENFRNIDIVVTHTAPGFCPPYELGGFVEMVIREGNDGQLKKDLLKERRDLNDAFRILKKNNDIKYHYYGHFHRTMFKEIDGTKYRLLNQGQLWEEMD